MNAPANFMLPLRDEEAALAAATPTFEDNAS